MMFKKLENDYDIKIMKVRCDNAGENVSLEKECIEKKMKIKLELKSLSAKIAMLFRYICTNLANLYSLVN